MSLQFGRAMLSFLCLFKLKKIMVASSHTAVMKVCWLASGETLGLLDPNDFAGRPISELKRFLKKLVDAPSYRQRLFPEDSSMEMKDDDILDPAVQTVRIVLSNTSLRDIVRFYVTPLPGVSYEVGLVLETGHTHRDMATQRTCDSRWSCFGLQEWPLLLKMIPDVTEASQHFWCKREFSRLSKCHTACPDHVPFPVGYVATELPSQRARSMAPAAVLLVEDVGENLASRCRGLANTDLDPGCDLTIKQWLCEIVAMTEEAYRKQLFWHVAFDAYTVCWNDRTQRWYLSELDIEGPVESFETCWQRAVNHFKLSVRYTNRALGTLFHLMEIHLTNPCEPITAVGLRRKFGLTMTWVIQTCLSANVIDLDESVWRVVTVPRVPFHQIASQIRVAIWVGVTNWPFTGHVSC